MFDLNNKDIHNRIYTKEKYEDIIDDGIIYTYKGKKYYYKHRNDHCSCCEILASRIAKKLGISCCHYFLTKNYKDIGVSCELSDSNYFREMSFVVGRDGNDFETIWSTFAKLYDDETVKRLMDDLVDIFLFDVLTANWDRQAKNYGLIVGDGDVRFAPLYDNECILYESVIKTGDCALLVSHDDFEGMYVDDFFMGNHNDIHEKFFAESDDMYKDRLRKMLFAISEETLLEIFAEIEKDENCIITVEEREKVLTKFAANRSKIDRLISK